MGCGLWAVGCVLAPYVHIPTAGHHLLAAHISNKLCTISLLPLRTCQQLVHQIIVTNTDPEALFHIHYIPGFHTNK